MSNQPNTASDRIHALDSLRGAAMLLGIVLHGSLAYVQTPIPWAVADASKSLVFDLILVGVHGFRMQLFFVLAGFFGCLLYERMGAKDFAKQRTLRIFLPFIVGMLTIAPLVMGEFIYGNLRQLNPTFSPDLSSSPWWEKIGSVHLWFLQYLTIFYAVALAAIPFWRKLSMTRWPERVHHIFGTLLKSRIKPLPLAIVSMTILSFSADWFNPENSGTQLLPTVCGLIYYLSFFTFGWLLYQQRDLLNNFKRDYSSNLRLAAYSMLPVLVTAMSSQMYHAADYELLKFIGTFFYSLYTWFMIFGCVGLFLRHADVSHPSIRYLADASYWFYLWHLPIVVGLQIWLYSFELNAFVKFSLLNVVTVLVLWATYHFGVRYTWVGRWLNGPRKRPQATPPATPALSSTP